jgi:isopenicillin N synthase-like dioxygenase
LVPPHPRTPHSALTRDPAGSITSSALLSAFGPDSLGIIVVKDLPPRFKELRTRLLSYASHIAALPADALTALEAPHAKYLVGWSCGKETLSADGRVDTLKGSYYVNCAFYKDALLDGADGAERYPDFAEYTAGNVWPTQLEGFEETCKELCTLIIDTAALVARACDRYAAENIDGYEEGYLEHVVKTSTTTKARLLHYFPPPKGAEDDGEEDLDSWCGTHLDHGCLTGLTSAMYVDEAANPPVFSAEKVELPELEGGPPDKEAGLYIKDRTGNIVKVGIPRDGLAFQTGEALERITRGRFKAVPHFVRGMRPSKGVGVARNTLAVFTREFPGEP